MANRINSRSKGSKNERGLSKLFQTWTGYDFGRVPSSGGLRWKRTTDTTGDIICTDKKHYRFFCFSIEAKFHKALDFKDLLNGNKTCNILDFYNQALEDGQRGHKIPLLFMRYNGLAKDVHYVVLTNGFYQLIKPLYTNTMGIIHYKYKTYNFIIMHSEDFFKLPYITVHKLTKKYLRDVTTII